MKNRKMTENLTENHSTRDNSAILLLRGLPRYLHICKELYAILMVGKKVVPSDQEEKAGDFVQDFLQPFLEGSEDYVQEYSPGTATAIVTKGEVALAAQTLLLWKSSERIERLTRWLIGLTGTLVALTVVLAILTWRLGG